MKNNLFKTPSRRSFLAGTGALVATPAILTTTRSYAANKTLKVGYVHPKTGPLAGFAEADDFIIVFFFFFIIGILFVPLLL